MMQERLRDLWIVITADKKKAGVLGGLLVVALVLWARTALTESPKRAAASDDQATTQTSTGTAGDSGDGANGSEKPREIVRAVSPALLQRDLFAVSDERLAPPAQPDPSEEAGHKSEAGSDDKPVEQERSARLTRDERVREEARRLRLRSTMLGRRPMAVIEVTKDRSRTSGVVRLGESIEGFRVVEIAARAAVLEKDGVRVVLERERH